MDRLSGAVQTYDWGSTTEIAELQGRPSTGEPEAELWIGAHPMGPSRLARDGHEVSLDEVIAADPDRALGPQVAAVFGGELPFLMKVIAAARPLSIQAHPDRRQAAAGFAREEANGIARGAPERVFRDPHHKPELICALTPFRAMCGFRAVEGTVELLRRLGAPSLVELAEELDAGPGPDALRDIVGRLLRAPAPDAAAIVDEVVDATRNPPEGYETESAFVAELGSHAPGDRGVVVGLFLNSVELRPGEAMFVGAGQLHCYVGGTAVEVMASSDNVVRGGVTTKPIAVETLLEIVDVRTGMPEVQRAGTAPIHRFDAPAPEFELARVRSAGTAELGSVGPALLLVTDGQLTARVGREAIDLRRGESAWVPADDGDLRLDGQGEVFIASAALPV